MTDSPLQRAAYVFLSYASADRERALRIADRLEVAGVSVWMDRKSIAGGTSWSAEIVRGIEACTVLAVLCSSASMASPNVQQEIQLAWESRRPILPLLLERSHPPEAIRYALAGRQWIEILDRLEDAWLPAALKALAGLGVGSAGRAAGEAPPTVPRPVDAEPVQRHNLPVPVTSFVGRERELAEIRERLQRTHLLTLTGTGGCGKTRLALQVAVAVLEEYPDGVWLAELAPLADPDLVPATVAAAAGIRSGPVQPIQVALLSALRSRQLLILLDNCEHLIDACARLADAILRGCPGVRILATSREGLGIGGEVAWRVPSLAVGLNQPNPSLLELRGSEAVRLFVDRALAVQPALALTAQNGPVVVQICQRLDGIPLAIELAATRVKALSVEQIAARLDQRFRLLTGGSRAALPRQQTLGALVGWSYDLLSQAERTLFNRLSVFAGGFTLEAAEAVAGVGEGALPVSTAQDPALDASSVLDLLAQLVDKSLVVAETGAEGAVWYRLLETLRQYGRDKLVAAEEAETFHRRHAAYYLALAEEAGPHLQDRQQLVWLTRLDRELDNLRAALRWCAESGEEREERDGLRACQALSGFWWFRGHVGEGRSWLDLFLARPGTADRDVLRARALGTAQWFAYTQGGSGVARELGNEALAIAQEVGDPLARAEVMSTVAHQWERSDSHQLLEEALGLFRELGDRWGMTGALTTLGVVTDRRGDSAGALVYLEESLQTARALGERRGIAVALEVLGDVTSERDEAVARANLVESLTLYQELGDLTGVASVENLLGRLDCLSGRLALASDHYRASLRLTKDWAWTWRLTQSLDGLAVVAAGQGQDDRALRLAGASAHLREVANQEPTPRDDAFVQAALGPLRQSMGAEANAAWAEGQAMTLEAAVAYALSAEPQ